VLALHEIDVYAALASGMYRYDPLHHCLDRVIAADLRALTGYQEFVGEAPLETGLCGRPRPHARHRPIATRAVCICKRSGAMMQNVYLFCAATGLAVAARSWLNRSALGAQMHLPRDSVPVLAQSIGHFDSADAHDTR
jgi:nitroreductase